MRLDPYGNVDPTFNGNVTLALANNPGGSYAGRNADRGGVNGVATFSGLTINKPGSGYTLKATSGGLTAATSAAFDVTDQLVVTTQPPSTVTAGSRSAWSSRPRMARAMWTPPTAAA